MVVVVRVAIIYYSNTGRTASVAQYIKDSLTQLGHQVDMYRLRCVREYGRNFLRMVLDVFLDRAVSFSGTEGFNPDNYELVVVGTPIWANRITPPIKSFLIRYSGLIKADTACYTSSKYRKEYSKKLREFMEELGYKVKADVGITDLQAEEDLLKKFIAEVTSK